MGSVLSLLGVLGALHVYYANRGTSDDAVHDWTNTTANNINSGMK